MRGDDAGRRADGVGALTPRQREVLLLIARGLSNSEIEVELGITRATCRSHITALLARLGARDRAQLVIAAYEAGLISPRQGAWAGGGTRPSVPPRRPRHPPTHPDTPAPRCPDAPGRVELVMSPQLTLCELSSHESSSGGFCRAELTSCELR